MTQPPLPLSAYMDQMDLWLMKHREMTAEKYNVKRSTFLLCAAHVSNADIQVGFKAVKCVSPPPRVHGKRTDCEWGE